ncbi:MAG: hypothetical protein J6J26_03010 [Bacteroides sp.]|nr:hypothetical protein [Bacteroides sp.]
MRPIKNRMFCLECKRPKMLFESKGKALNFIKFNSDEIKNENGIAPTRVYYCKSCGGWHVTSRIQPVSERKQIRNYIGKAYRLFGEKHWAQAQRFLCYAEEKLRFVNEVLIPSPMDEELRKEIRKAKRKLDYFALSCKNKLSALGPVPMFKYADLSYNSLELEVEGMCDDTENGGIVYTVRPNLLTQHDGKYYYVICSCNLNEKEVQITKKMNDYDEQDDSIQTIICHDLNMVEIKHSFGSNCKNQYENVSEVFLGKLLGMWKLGMQLRLAERVEKSYKYIYYKYTGFDYWIKLADRNIHFYLGRPFRYTCIVSSTPLDTSQAFHLFRESI